MKPVDLYGLKLKGPKKVRVYKPDPWVGPAVFILLLAAIILLAAKCRIGELQREQEEALERSEQTLKQVRNTLDRWEPLWAGHESKFGK